MKLNSDSLSLLSNRIQVERKAQGLSREQAAAICNVSTSFIRDAESKPAQCSLGKLLLLMQGLGLSMAVMGWWDESESSQGDAPNPADASPATHPDAS